MKIVLLQFSIYIFTNFRSCGHRRQFCRFDSQRKTLFNIATENGARYCSQQNVCHQLGFGWYAFGCKYASQTYTVM